MSADTRQFPAAKVFVGELIRRVDRSYPATLSAITRTVAKLETDQALLLGWMRHGLTRSAFALGCTAEEIASVSGLFESAEEQRFIREVVEHLKVPLKPLPAKRIGPALRRLIKEFKLDPTHSRTGTVQYMLELQHLEEIGKRLEINSSCTLALECTVTVDGIAGLLWEQIMVPQASPSGRGVPRRYFVDGQLQL